MTTLQLGYHNLLETQRSNLAKEQETNRSNLAKELETVRSNKAQESLKSEDIAEKRRANMFKPVKDLTETLLMPVNTAVKAVTSFI